MFSLGEDTFWVAQREYVLDEEPYRRVGARKVGPSGSYGEWIWVPKVDFGAVTYTVNGREARAPLSGREVWTPTPLGGAAFQGSSEYRYDVLRRDGAMLIVHRYWEPVPIPPEQREWERQVTVAGRREQEPGFNWNGAEIPHHKQAIGGSTPTLSGEMWVSREGESRRVADCVEHPIEAGQRAARERPCWEFDVIVDAFGEDGRYLGEVQFPPNTFLSGTDLSVRERVVVTVARDEAGTIMVKRYRLVLPGEGS